MALRTTVEPSTRGRSESSPPRPPWWLCRWRASRGQRRRPGDLRRLRSRVGHRRQRRGRGPRRRDGRGRDLPAPPRPDGRGGAREGGLDTRSNRGYRKALIAAAVDQPVLADQGGLQRRRQLPQGRRPDHPGRRRPAGSTSSSAERRTSWARSSAPRCTRSSTRDKAAGRAVVGAVASRQPSAAKVSAHQRRAVADADAARLDQAGRPRRIRRRRRCRRKWQRPHPSSTRRARTTSASTRSTVPPAYNGKTQYSTNICGYTPEAAALARTASTRLGKQGPQRHRPDDRDHRRVRVSPSILKDANTYSQQNGEPGPDQLQLPAARSEARAQFTDQDLCQQPSGWQGEQTLDVESVHGIAPGARILYVGGFNCWRRPRHRDVEDPRQQARQHRQQQLRQRRRGCPGRRDPGRGQPAAPGGGRGHRPLLLQR